jgi:hypothetical protein
MPDDLTQGLEGGLLDYLDRGNRVRVAKGSRVAYVTSMDVIGSNGKGIAMIQSLTGVQMTRQVKYIRMLNSVDAGSGIELLPGVVDIKFTINSLTLWPSDDGVPNTLANRVMQEREIYPGAISDTEYFDIGLVVNHPYTNKASYTLWFLNCMMSDLSYNNIDIAGDNFITETASVTALRTGYTRAEIEA